MATFPPAAFSPRQFQVRFSPPCTQFSLPCTRGIMSPCIMGEPCFASKGLPVPGSLFAHVDVRSQFKTSFRLLSPSSPRDVYDDLRQNTSAGKAAARLTRWLSAAQ